MLTACQNDDSKEYGATSKVNVGDAVPDFVLTGANGETVSAASLSGKAYLLTFFDTGCPDCQKELPVLQQVYDKYKDKLAVLNVPRSQSVNEVEQYWSEAGLSMPVYAPLDKDLYYQFATSVIPRTYVVDSQGIVQAVLTDSPLADLNKLDALVQNLLKHGADNGTVDLSVRIRVPGTRGAEEDYFQNEYTISHLELFFFDADTKKFVTKAVVEDLTQDDDPYDKLYDITYVLKSVRIRVGLYNIFAIANYDHTPENIDNQDDFLNMVDSVTYKAGIEPNIPSKGPVMTSRATSLLAVNLVPASGKNYFLTINMERVLAKLQIGVKQNNFELRHDNRKYADINITNYKLVNLNRQYFLFLHRDEMTALGEKPAFLMPDNFSDYADEGNQYVIDPLFYKKTTAKDDAVQFRNYYESWFGDFTTEHFASIPAVGNYGYAYILENTAFKTSQKNGYSPGIVFKAAVSPSFVYLYDLKTKKLIEEYRAEYWSHTIYLYKYNFYGSIQAVNVASGLMLDELETYTDAQLKQYGIKKCEFNMGVYETYYTYWIRHRNGTEKSLGPMDYVVVRNNFYKIVVAGVSGIGDSEVIPEIMRDNYPNSYEDIVVDE
jgi:peroxiredoxin